MNNFHDEVWQMETESLNSDAAWIKWTNYVETYLGHDLDGDQEKDGYSIDHAYDAYRGGMTAKAYASLVIYGPSREY